MKLTGAKVLLECLKEQDVDIIFGYPGGAVLPIYDALYSENGIRHILTAHEQGATHAADGYARTTGKVGVVITTSGPGATNAVTGIATAYMDSVPMVVFTGQVAQPFIGKSSFQEVNITSITASITKENYIVKEPENLADTIRKAFRTATSGRPGPVLVDIPKDIQNAEIEYTFKKAEKFTHKKCTSNLNEAINLILQSKKPMIFAGGGVNISNAADELYSFSKKIQCPVACSLMGIGSFPGNDELYTGMVGMHGTYASNHAISECDLLIAIGARFSDRVTSKINSFAPNAKIIHIDIDPSEFNKNLPEDVSICGDVKEVLSCLTALVSEKNHVEWVNKILSFKEAHPLKYLDASTLNPQLVLNKLYDLTKGDCIITTEVGQNQIWAAQFFTYNNPRTFITSGGLGTMGYGLSSAIGVAIGNKNKKVINIAGDGSFKMNSIELATVSKYKLPLVQLVLNNHVLGMVHQWQDMFYEGNFSSSEFGPEVDFVKLGEAYGIKSMRITKNEDIEDTLKLALSLNEPIIVECDICPNDKVFPIVAPGASITDLIENE
ncbi:acetolactate synthase, large subunit [Clostridium acidisoli DSM 12555]|uniref:Acetolactate synthase n=1 Tax=Clostridium acidisoli DSM 12555 TaxID=1121291 RepID=A0A1W1X4K8_9CLOT|nr:biosynthetic-type acetolactate synthase large subunit [Clostridium acidisoli]SMC18846.1 acetolactate synthase, large subunit [Clostridium acidisoli DSM 12555]